MKIRHSVHQNVTVADIENLYSLTNQNSASSNIS